MFRLFSAVLGFIISFNLIFSQSFPKDWVGNWKGDLMVVLKDGLEKKIADMQLTISNSESDKWDWTIQYGEQDVRTYELIYEKASNQFVIDEKNGIQLVLSVFGNKAFSLFEVQGTLVNVLYTYQNSFIQFDLTFFPLKDSKETGNGTKNSPKVQTHVIGTVQKAILHRQN